MSDFIYSKKTIRQGKLTKEIQRIYHEDKPYVREFHGEWGSLAVSNNHYNGFQPYETNEHICIVMGGPVLYFQDNGFLEDPPGCMGTQAIFSRWLKGDINWGEDLSGPFVILIINKDTSMVKCVTDLMSFIPVYAFYDSVNIQISTHVDVLARVSSQQDNIDMVSQIDFILHGVITYPYTTYKMIKQISPATEYSIADNSCELHSINYWVPEEKSDYKTLNQAAEELRNGLQNYIYKITNGVSSNIAQFISGGEDSRVIAALMPKDYKHDAFVFLDYMNREGKVAKKAANAYGANFHLGKRSKLHYLEIMSACADLVGSGSQYTHGHTYGFHKSCKLNEYSAVFGGLYSDALLKGARIKKISGLRLIPFLPQIKDRNYSVAKQLLNNIFNSEVLSELTKRRQEHLKYVKSFRKESSEEWFHLWPSSMNPNIPNHHINRRLFRSYEPFMSKDVVKISSSIPQKWKLNRRLFHKTAKPFIKPTKWLFHSEGRLPYFPWYINSFLQLFVWTYQQLGRRTGIIKGNQGPWGEWNKVMNSPEWKQAINEYSEGIKVISSVINEKEIEIDLLFRDKNLGRTQRINLMQTLYSNLKNRI